MDEDGSDLVDKDSELSLDSEPIMEAGCLNEEWESRPKSLRDNCFSGDWDMDSDSEVDIYMGEEEYFQKKWLRSNREYEGDCEEEEGDEEEEDDDDEWDSSIATGYYRALRDHFPLLQKGQQTTGSKWGSEAELEYLRDGEFIKLSGGSLFVYISKLILSNLLKPNGTQMKWCVCVKG